MTRRQRGRGKWVILATCHWDESHVAGCLGFGIRYQDGTHWPIGRRQKLWKHLKGLAKRCGWKEDVEMGKKRNEKKRQERREKRGARKNCNRVTKHWGAACVPNSSHFPDERVGKFLWNYKLMLGLCENRSAKTQKVPKRQQPQQQQQEGEEASKKRREEKSKKYLKVWAAWPMGYKSSKNPPPPPLSPWGALVPNVAYATSPWNVRKLTDWLSACRKGCWLIAGTVVYTNLVSRRA